jgi:integrase
VTRKVAARALEFTILTAARTGECIGATWSEISWTDKVWMIPGRRMKGAREHRVPLCERALTILREMEPPGNISNAAQQFVFSGGKPGRPLSNMAFLMLLRRMGRADLTAHGFRSSFRDWAAEQTNFPGEVAEMALAHVASSKVEAAYRRGDLFEKRRRLMQQWAMFCTAAPVGERQSGVTPMRRKA